jgi:hypothetical protein
VATISIVGRQTKQLHQQSGYHQYDGKVLSDNPDCERSFHGKPIYLYYFQSHAIE